MKYKCFRCENMKPILKMYIRHLKRKYSCPNLNNLDVSTLLKEIEENRYT